MALLSMSFFLITRLIVLLKHFHPGFPLGLRQLAILCHALDFLDLTEIVSE